MPELKLIGRFFSYELQEIDKETAGEIIDEGIDVDDLEEMDFADGGDRGIALDGEIFEDGQMVMRFDIEEMPQSHPEIVPATWMIMKIETGKCECGPIEIDGQFSEEKIRFAKYELSVGDVSASYAGATYSEVDFEFSYASTQSQDYVIISPEGTSFEFDVND